MASPHTPRDASLARLEHLQDQGRQLQKRLAADPSDPDASDTARAWQRESAALISDLSGGSKAHWLSRAHSEALLVRAADGRATTDAPIADIIGRMLDVLGRAMSTLAQADLATSDSAGTPHRFDFVHDVALRPVLEAAYLESRRALEQGRFGPAFVTSCSLIEAILTDALVRAGRERLSGHGAPEEAIEAWPFEMRIAAAERAGLIRGGCARLPPSARRYRDLTDAEGELRTDVTVTERDARVTGQVLHVMMRDLDPGR